MNRQESLHHLKMVLRHDLNDNLKATALRTVLAVVIESVNSIDIKPGEELFLQKRNTALAALQRAMTREVADAVSYERTHKHRNALTRDYYNQAVSAIEQPLREVIVAMEQLELDRPAE